MFFELDFLPVDSGERSGDAICMRYGEREEEQIVIVIDGGTVETGENLVEHIKNFYNTDVVDHVISTHPDSDHVSGLRKVVEELDVKNVWMHQPWNHAEELKDKFKDTRFTTEGLAKKLREAYSLAAELEEIAEEKGVPISEPFQGMQVGVFLVLSPTLDWYLDLVPQFDNTPEAKTVSEGFFKKAIRAVLSWIDEEWDIETLSETANTSPSNESSVILYANLDDKKILLTADSGIQALGAAADYAEDNEIDLKKGNFYQIPHHGSRNNVTPTVLNRIIGNKLPKGSQKIKIGLASVSSQSKTHPRKVVTNAFQRRGVETYKTDSEWVCYRHNIKSRENATNMEPIEFSSQVEASE